MEALRIAMNGKVLVALMAVATAEPACAQIFDSPTEDTRANGIVQAPSSGQSARRRGDSTSNDVALDQVQTNGQQDRFTADEIDNGRDRPLRDRTSADDPTSARDGRSLEGGNRRIVPKAEPSEFEVFASEVADKTLRRFGAQLLVPEARDFTTPPDTIVPPDYRMNAGDVLLLGLTGSVEVSNLKLTIDTEGKIFLPRVGPVRVAGLRYADLQTAISAQIARHYRNFQLSVSVTRLHGITVYVTGFANVPGSYTVSSLSTLVNAVFASGGPSAGGSFRSIQLRRDGKLVADFDLYDLLLKGDKTNDAVLQNGDVIFIAPVGAQVAVIGSANNEAIFEARPEDTLTDVLRYAGGVNTAANLDTLLTLDPLDLESGWQQVTAADASGQVAKRAQVLRVVTKLGIARPLSKQNVFVTVGGEVAHPGRYFLQPGASIAQVIEQAGGLTPDAYVFGTVFTRESLRLAERKNYERAVRDIEYLLTAAPLTSTLSKESDTSRIVQLRSVVAQLRDRKPDGRLILDMDADAARLPGNVMLENNDTIYIPPVMHSVGVFGAVPGAGSFQFRPGMTVGDYLREAGGVQKLGDRGQTFVVRANGKLLAPKRGFLAGSVLKEPALPGDLVYVPINPSRGEFFAKLNALTTTLFTGAVTTAAVVSATR